jgi:hypothetical protein
MKAAQDRHKSYANTRWRPLKFHEGNKMFLKVALHLLRFGIKRKLTSRYIGPFEVIKRIGLIAYKLALPLHLAMIHDVSHVSLL